MVWLERSDRIGAAAAPAAVATVTRNPSRAHEPARPRSFRATATLRLLCGRSPVC